MIVSIASISSKYNIQDIIQALEDHKTKHIEDYKKAVAVYQKDILENLKALTKKIRKEIPDGTKTFVERNFSLTPPKNCEDGYQRVIDIFKKSQEQNIELSMQDADKIFNDEWDWALSAKISNSFYSSRG